MIDYHIHTALCGHAEGDVIDYVKKARELGLREIGFADHLPLLVNWDPTLTMSMDQLEDYIELVEGLKKEFSDLVIKLGIEADYLPGLEKETERLINSYDFDYVIGSIHFIKGWGFDDNRYIEGYKDRDIYDVYAQYFELVAGAAKTGFFDIIGHMDLVKKFNFKPDKDITPLIEEAVSAIKDSGVCIEINTAGLRKPAGEIYPSPSILRLCYEAGVPVTVGSDAHSPEQVGQDIDLALGLASQAGYDRIAIFSGRRRVLIDIH